MRLTRTITGKTAASLDAAERRSRIIEEHRLRQEVARDEELRKQNPDYWRRMEAVRIAHNRANAELNRRLRAARCQGVAMWPTLDQKMKKLQHLEARNRAEIATQKKRP